MAFNALEDVGISSGQEAIILCQQLLLVKAGSAQTRPYHAVGLPLQHMRHMPDVARLLFTQC